MPTAPGATMMDSKLFIMRTHEPWRDLYERWWDGEEWVWADHGRPQGVPLLTSPGAAMLDCKCVPAPSHRACALPMWTWTC